MTRITDGHGSGCSIHQTLDIRTCDCLYLQHLETVDEEKHELINVLERIKILSSDSPIPQMREINKLVKEALK